MKQTAEILVVLVLILAGIMVINAPTYLDRTQTSIPPNPRFVTERANPEEYLACRQMVERFGKYQVVLNPRNDRRLYGFSEHLGTYGSGDPKSFRYLFEGIPFAEWTDGSGVRTRKSPGNQKLVFELELFCCLPGHSVAGGKLVVHSKAKSHALHDNRSWKLEFYQLGAEGIIYTDSPIPDWIGLAGKPGRDYGETRGFPEVLDQLFQANENGNKIQQLDQSRKLAQMLIEVAFREFRDET